MSDTYAIVLRACNSAATQTLAALLTKTFGLKEGTSTSIVSSAPLILVSDLSIDEVAALSLAIHHLENAGATLEYIPQDDDSCQNLPKIDWPHTPKIFKLDVATLIRSYQLPLQHNGSSVSILSMLKARILPSDDYAPQASNPAIQAPHATPQTRTVQEFTGAHLPEVTPFSNVALSSAPSTPAPSNDSDIGNRMDQLFGDDDDLVPSSQDITSVLDRLLPDETGSSAHHRPIVGGTSAANHSGATGAISSKPANTCSLFLSKIPDESRREKALPILIELTGISAEEAAQLIKKIIIPVLKNVSTEEAEAAKHRFSEIGVLARIK